jgi:translocation and assembly module TamB
LPVPLASDTYSARALTSDREIREKVPIKIKKFLIGLFILVILLPPLAAGLFWSMAGSTTGTRWLAGHVARLTGGILAWETLDGTLLHSLRMQGLRVRLPGTAIDIQALNLQWRPILLATGVVQVDAFTADGIRIALSESGETDSPSSPFDPAALDLPVTLNLEALALRDIELLVGNSPPRPIDSINLAARLHDHRLALEQLQVLAPEGGFTARGNIALTEAMPLDLFLHWSWRLPDQRQLAGEFEISGNATELAMEHRGLGDLPVNLQGKLLTILAQPRWQLDLAWPELTMGAGEAPLTVGPGQLHTQGDPDSYRVASEGRLFAPGVAPASWSLAAEGTRESIQLQPLTITSGRYLLALSGAVTWGGPIAANLTYRAEVEQLAALNPQLPARLDATGTLLASFEDQTLVVENLGLALEQASLQLKAQGSVRFPAGADPDLNLQLQWHSLQWPLTDEAAVSSPEGRVQLTGTPDAWKLDMAMQAAGSQIPAGDWLARAEGDSTELRLEYLQGNLLDGTVSLSGLVGWDPVPRWNLEGVGKDLNPVKWQPHIPGLIAFEVRSDGRLEAEGGPQATLELRRLAGELAGRPVSAMGKVAIAADVVTVDSLDLANGNNRFRASGRLDGERLALDWTLQVPDPGLLLQGAAGSLQASGRLGGSASSPQLSARLEGSDLQFQDQSLQRLTASVQAGLAAEAPLQLEFELWSLQQGGQILLDSVHLAGDGTTSGHQLDLELQSLSGHVRGRLEGGLRTPQSAWHGSLSALSINSTGFGNWQLAQAAPLDLSPERVALGDICLLGETLLASGEPDQEAARICAGGQWSPTRGARLESSLRTFALARLLPEMTGELSGDLWAALAPGGALTAQGGISVSGGEMNVETSDGRQQLAHGGGQLDLVIGPAGLQAELGFKPLQQGRLTAEVLLPQLHSLPMADSQPVAGRIRVELPDLSGLQGWVPELDDVAGRIDADLRLAGELQQPELEGELALTGGAADLPVAGLQLRDIVLRLRDDPETPGQMLLTGGLRSGKGEIALNGQLSSVGDRLALAVKGEDVEVFDTPDAQVLVSPDLNIGWGDDLLTLRGSVLVPRARITPRLGLSPGLASQEASPGAGLETEPLPGEIIAPSADVVVVGGDGELVAPAGSALPFLLDSQVQLLLGEKVLVNALGLNGRLAGKVTFSNMPGQTTVIPTANGLLSVQDGSFRAFGQDLEIEAGQVIFRKVPVTEPEINLRAVRWIDNDPLVSAAGVQLTGPASAPVMELFSQPQLDPSEIQSYLLTGQPASGGDSVLSIGTYLRPKLYVGYGYNLLEETSEFNSLYTITPRYGIESSVGEADNSLGVTITYEH